MSWMEKFAKKRIKGTTIECLNAKLVEGERSGRVKVTFNVVE